MAKPTTPRPCIKCGSDSVRPRIQPAGLNTGNLVSVLIQCANPECEYVHDHFTHEPEKPSDVGIGIKIERALKAYEHRIATGPEFGMETEDGILIPN